VLATPDLPVAPDPGPLLSVATLPGDRPGRVIVEVIGEVDTFTAPLLQVCLDSRTGQRDLRELVVDLAQVTLLGADGVAALLRAHRRCGRRGARLVLRGAGRCVPDPGHLGELAQPESIDVVDDDRPQPRGRRTVPRRRPRSLSRAPAASTATTARRAP
jgi:anti-sigma B factor antagonist